MEQFFGIVESIKFFYILYISMDFIKIQNLKRAIENPKMILHFFL